MTEKLPTLDGLRAISILLVLASHLLPLGPKFLLLNEIAGAMGMAIFFSLSGFLITHNLIDGQTVGEFFVRRAARILPLAYLYLIIVWLIFQPEASIVLQNILFIENYTYAWMGDGHFWSLCVEIHFYIAIGLSAAILGKRIIFLIPTTLLAVTAIRIWNIATIDIQTHLRVDEICAGGCVAIAYRYVEKSRINPTTLVAVAAMLALSSSSYSRWLQYFRPYFGGALLMSALLLKSSVIRRALISKQAAYIAKISYALYVIHPMTVHGWMNEGSVFERYILKRPISLLATFLIAHISSFYYEPKWVAFSKFLLRRRRIILRARFRATYKLR